MKHNNIPQDLLNSVEYTELNQAGLIYKKPTSKRIKIGDQVGYPFNEKYFRVNFKGKTYANHIIIWVLHNGPVPTGFDVDHKDTNKQNNKISNLRLATHSQNQHNKNMNKSNPLGIKGLYKYDHDPKYIGMISFQGKIHRFRHFDRSIVENWLIKTRKNLHGEYAHD